MAFTVAAAGPTGYYGQVNTSSPSQLRCSLHATIKGHTAYPYSGGTTNTCTVNVTGAQNVVIGNLNCGGTQGTGNGSGSSGGTRPQ